jgi:hypothetical protein
MMMTTCLKYLPNGTEADGAPGVVLLVHPCHKTIDASADIATASRRKLIGENLSPPLGRHPGTVALIPTGKERNGAKL